jgi:hypothetical protein
VTASAPRIRRPLLRALVRADDPREPIAEVCRAVGAEADRLGLTRPSYEQVRVIVQELRRRRAARAATRAVLFEVAVRARPIDALTKHFSGVGLPPL